MSLQQLFYAMTRTQRIQYLIEYFSTHNPDAASELEYTTPFELLVATILSAQCTDKRVNGITPTLFGTYPDAAAMAQATTEQIYTIIRSVSYPNSKSQHLQGMARMIVEQYNGEVPATVEDLMRLPGVGRKTANVVCAVAFGKSVMPVDTHVYRVSHRLGLVPKKADSPLAVERHLTASFPSDILPTAHHWLLLHGRYICTSLKPKCSDCPLESICPKLLNHSKLQR